MYVDIVLVLLSGDEIAGRPLPGSAQQHHDMAFGITIYDLLPCRWNEDLKSVKCKHAWRDIALRWDQRELHTYIMTQEADVTWRSNLRKYKYYCRV